MNGVSLRLNIPVTIEEYIMAKTAGDSEECDLVRNRFREVYDTSSAELQGSIERYISKYLTKSQVSLNKELNGLFEPTLINRLIQAST